MEKCLSPKANAIRIMAKGDDAYYQMLKRVRIQEKHFHEVLSALPTKEQDIVCDYLALCEEMGWRMLEIACEIMEFPEERK